MEYFTYFVFYKDGSSKSVQFPTDWTVEDVKKAEQADEIMGPYTVKN